MARTETILTTQEIIAVQQLTDTPNSTLVYKDSAGDIVGLGVGTGLSVSGGNLNASGGSGLSQGLISNVRNNTGATLYKGTIVYVTGGIGGNPTVAKAQANLEATSAGTFGAVYADIPNNSNGQVLTAGRIDTLDTRTTATNPFTSVTLADGDKLYLDPTTAGYVTNVKPSAPNNLVYIGVVTNTSPTSGTIEYHIVNGFELNELHDVSITSIANNDILQYESATSLWKNRDLLASIGSRFTTGSIPFSNGTTLLEDNANFVWDDTNNRLGIGTNFPEARLSVVTGTLNSSAVFLPLAPGGINESYTAITGKYAVGNNFCRSDIRFGAENIGIGTGFLAFATGTNTTTEKMRITSGGNVGIGTTAPASRVTISEGNSFTNIGELVGGTAYSGIRFGSNAALTTSNYNIISDGGDLLLNRPTGYSINFRANNSTQMTILPNGYVGIGLSTPTAHLEVYGGAAGTVTNILVGNATTGFQFGIDSAGACQIRTFQAVPMLWYTSGAERMRITAGGVLGVGTSTPLGRIASFAANSDTILPTTGTYQQVEITGASGNEALRLSIGVTTSTIGGHLAGTGVIQPLVNASHFTNLLLNPNGGNVGIRMPGVAPTAFLHLGAGTATAGTAPLKFTAGTALTTPEAGTFEFTNSETGLTFTAVATRRQVVLDTATQTLTNKTLTTPVLNGIPTGTGVATGATVNTLALRDANGNLNFNNWVGAYTSTATSAGTLVLTVASSNLQRFSGTTTHTVTLPVASTLANGHQYEFINDSTGAVTINSSGGNLVYTLPANGRVFITCILNSGTTATSWTTAVIGGSGGSSAPRQFRISIPGELVADTAGYQGFFWYNDTGSSITISNVAVAVSKAGTTCSVNLYKSSGTAVDGIDTNAVNLFTSAIALGSGYTSLTNVPNTTTVEAGRWVSGRVTAVAGAPANLQIIVTY